ncbi:ATP synthase protein I [Paenibacillus sp. DS2015]|uniref:ATP synthase subunit I n=1 Tax=Paenibacillus sp. DS2015 TaxID=3373917 RepID=UPI003D19DDD0
MGDIASILKGVTRLSLVIMAGLVMGWALHPESRIYTLGMAVGMVAGLVNTSYLSMRIRKVIHAVTTQESRAFSLGFLSRICFSILAVMFSVKYEHFSLELTIAGLFLPQLLTIPVGIYLSVKKKI